MFQTQSVLLDHVNSVLGEDPIARSDLAEAYRNVEAIGEPFDFVIRLGIVTAEGELVTAADPDADRGDVSGRDYFQIMREQRPTLIVDRFSLAPSGQDAIVVVRPRLGETFNGVVIAALDISILSDFLAGIAGSRGSAASLIRADGKLLIRHEPRNTPLMLPADAPAMTAIRSASAGLYEAKATVDGVERIYAFAQVGNLPIFAHFGVAKHAIWASWREAMLVPAILLLLSAALAFWGLTQTLRRLQADAAAQAARFDRRLLEEAQRTAQFKETLLRELHHRVKNNLHQVQALLRTRKPRGGDARSVLDEIENRVWAIAEVHELLHESERLEALDLSELIRAICTNASIIPPERNVVLELDTEPVDVNIDLATPVALMLVELVTNAMKHAFPDERPGRITVSLRRIGSSGRITIVDDGVGMPAESARSRTSGLRLVEGLVRQIGGVLTTKSVAGTAFLIDFPLAGRHGMTADESPLELRQTA